MDRMFINIVRSSKFYRHNFRESNFLETLRNIRTSFDSHSSTPIIVKKQYMGRACNQIEKNKYNSKA